MHLASDRLGRCLETTLAVICLVRLLVAVAIVLPAASTIGAARLDTALFLAVIGRTAALFTLLDTRFRLLVQGTLLALTRLGLSGNLLLGLLCRLGSGSSNLCLLTHLRQLELASLLLLELTLLDFAQTAGTKRRLFARFQFLLANDRCTIEDRGHTFFNDHLRLRLGLKHWLGNDFRLGFRNNLDNRLGNDLDHFRNHLDDRLRNHLGHWRLDGILGHFRLGFRGLLANVALDQHAFLANLDLNRAGTAMGVGCLDLGRLLAHQRDLGLGLIAMRTAQVIQKFGLVLIGQRIARPFLADASLAQLLEQGRDRHF